MMQNKNKRRAPEHAYFCRFLDETYQQTVSYLHVVFESTSHGESWGGGVLDPGFGHESTCKSRSSLDVPLITGEATTMTIRNKAEQ